MAIGRRFYFDSCMREDCNEGMAEYYSAELSILIHACVKIVTLAAPGLSCT